MESQRSGDSGYNGNGAPHIYSDTAHQVRDEETLPLNTYHDFPNNATPSTSGSGEGSYAPDHKTIIPNKMSRFNLIKEKHWQPAEYTKDKSYNKNPIFFPKNKTSETEPFLHTIEEPLDEDPYCPPAPAVLVARDIQSKLPNTSTVNELALSPQPGPLESPSIPPDETNTSTHPASPRRLVPDCSKDSNPTQPSSLPDADVQNIEETIPNRNPDSHYARVSKPVLYQFEDSDGDNNTSGAKSGTSYEWDSSDDDGDINPGQVQRSVPQVLPSTEHRDQIQNANHGNTNGANTNKTSNVMDLVAQVPKTNTDGIAPAQPEKNKDNADVPDTHDISPPVSAPTQLVTDGASAAPSEMPRESSMQENDLESQKVADITEDVIDGSSGEQYEWDSSDDDDDDSGGYKKRANNGIKEEFDSDE